MNDCQIALARLALSNASAGRNRNGCRLELFLDADFQSRARCVNDMTQAGGGAADSICTYVYGCARPSMAVP
jgi:hypothetical protein